MVRLLHFLESAFFVFCHFEINGCPPFLPFYIFLASPAGAITPGTAQLLFIFTIQIFFKGKKSSVNPFLVLDAPRFQPALIVILEILLFIMFLSSKY